MSSSPAVGPGQQRAAGQSVSWVDESVHVGDGQEGMYVLAAVVGEEGERLDEVRAGLRGLVVGPGKRLHWNAELEKTKIAIIEYLEGADLMHVVTIRTPVSATKQERARRKCLERLLHELDGCGVAQVWLESRQGALDRRDLQLVDAVRGRGSISRALRVDFQRPLGEPMLWVPDAVAGAVSHARKTGDGCYRDPLAGLLQEILV